MASWDQLYFKVINAWTKAGMASCVHVKGGDNKDDNFLLDCGVSESSTHSAKAVFISHGHIDHSGACISHARGKALKSSSSSYYVPDVMYDPLLRAKNAFEEMDGKAIPMNIVPVTAGQSIQVNPRIRVVPFATEHRVPSLGYAFYRKVQSLRKELRDLPSKEVYIRKNNGEEIYDTTEILELVYTGDTLFSALLRPEHAFLFTSQLFITELTYLDGERSKAISYSHIHLEDILEYAFLFTGSRSAGQSNDLEEKDQELDSIQGPNKVFFVHLSDRYTAGRVMEVLQSSLPDALREKAGVSLFSFGAKFPVSYLHDRRLREEALSSPGHGWARQPLYSQSNNQFFYTSNPGTGPQQEAGARGRHHSVDGINLGTDEES